MVKPLKMIYRRNHPPLSHFSQAPDSAVFLSDSNLGVGENNPRAGKLMQQLGSNSCIMSICLQFGFNVVFKRCLLTCKFIKYHTIIEYQIDSSK